LIILLGPAVFAARKTPILFSGRVESIDPKLETVAVKHGDIPGFMPAMIMDYPVENHEVLSRVSVGDEIAATVYVGDPTLHDLRIVKHDPDAKRR
jgi:Cu/Ag efflux protein CusF